MSVPSSVKMLPRVKPRAARAGRINSVKQPLIDIARAVKPHSVIQACNLHAVAMITASVGQTRGAEQSRIRLID